MSDDAAITAVAIDTGELLLVPHELSAAIDAGIAAGACHDDPGEAAEAFRKAFGKALHQAGLLLVARARSNSRESVYVDTYALALDGKHAAERLLGTIGALVKGSATLDPLSDHFTAGILSLAGRRPPEDRARIEVAMLRLRAIAALIDGCGDVEAMPPFDDDLVRFFNGEVGR